MIHYDENIGCSSFLVSSVLKFFLGVTKFDRCPYSGHCGDSNSATLRFDLLFQGL